MGREAGLTRRRRKLASLTLRDPRIACVALALQSFESEFNANCTQTWPPKSILNSFPSTKHRAVKKGYYNTHPRPSLRRSFRPVLIPGYTSIAELFREHASTHDCQEAVWWQTCKGSPELPMNVFILIAGA